MVEKEIFSEIKVLVADQQAQFRNIMRAALLAIRVHDIKIVDSGEKIIEAVNSGTFDVVIIDRDFPGLSGLGVVKKLRATANSNKPMLPIIMMATNWSYPDISAARDAGVNEYLVKPFSPAQLQKRLEEIILNPRPFVKDNGFFGPDRRRVENPGYHGAERRVNEPVFINPEMQKKESVDEFDLF